MEDNPPDELFFTDEEAGLFFCGNEQPLEAEDCAEEEIQSLIDDGEISNEEEGFMRGYCNASGPSD